MKHSNHLILLAMLAVSSTAFAQTDGNGNPPQHDTDINVTVNGNTVNFRGQGPVMSQDRVFVPLRGVFQRMGAHVDWDPSTQTVSADRGQTHVRLTIGLRTASINGQPTNLDLPPQIMEGVTMVPLRFVSEALGGTVDWNSQDETVMIDAGKYYVAAPGDVKTYAQRPGQPRGDAGTRPMRMGTSDVLRAGTVIQATLTTDVNSDTNGRGDRIMADVTDNSAGLPDGTKLQGYVQGVRPRSGDQPGWLNLRFTKLIMPNGNTYPVSGTFMGNGRVGANWVHNAHFRTGTSFGVRLSNSIHIGG
jgi:hypothetical protein